jgi:hypothetical protein
LRAAREVFLADEDQWSAVMALNALLWLDELLGDAERDPDEYRILLQEAKEVGSDLEIANALANNAYLANSQGRHAEAAGYLEQSLAVLQRLRNKGSTSYILDRMADVTLKLGDHEKAARLLGAGEAIRLNINAMPLTGARGPDVLRAEIAEAIGETALEEALAEGRSMSFDAAVDYARSGIPITR